MFEVQITTPERTIFTGKADHLTAPGKDKGSFGILDNHAPMITSLEMGAVTLRNAGKEEIFLVTGGFLEVKDNKVIVLADAIRDQATD